MAAFLDAERREAAWRRDVAEGIKRLSGIKPGTRAMTKNRDENVPDDAQSAARIRADVLVMLEEERK